MKSSSLDEQPFLTISQRKNKKGVMKPKKLNWFWSDDKEEDFWSMLEDERERKLWSYQLYRERTMLRWTVILPVIVFGLGMLDNRLALGTLFLFGWGMIYINTESKIRILRLYELLSVANKRI